jgi:hypothetical protein
MGLLSEDRTLADVPNESSIQKDDFLASSNALPGNIRKRQSREPDGPVWAMPSFPAKTALIGREYATTWRAHNSHSERDLESYAMSSA